MEKGELKDIKIIMKILNDRYSGNKMINLSYLLGLENKILSKIEITELKREIKFLKKLEYGLVFGLFVLFLLFLPGKIQNGMDHPPLQNSETFSSFEIEDAVKRVEESLNSYLDMETVLNIIPLNDGDLSEKY